MEVRVFYLNPQSKSGTYTCTSRMSHENAIRRHCEVNKIISGLIRVPESLPDGPDRELKLFRKKQIRRATPNVWRAMQPPATEQERHVLLCSESDHRIVIDFGFHNISTYQVSLYWLNLPHLFDNQHNPSNDFFKKQRGCPLRFSFIAN